MGMREAWLHGDQWDTVMNYDAFMEPLTWFFTGMEKHSDDYQQGHARQCGQLQRSNGVSYGILPWHRPCRWL